MPLLPPDDPPVSGPVEQLKRRLEAPPRLIVALVAAICFVRLQDLIPSLWEHDGYYHIKVAELFVRHGFLDAFPWAAFSLFRDHFGDKELLFHVFLIPFTGLGLIPGAKLATVLLDTAVVTLAYHLLRAHRVKAPALWLVLFVCAASLFFWRMGQCRPHLGSILCVLAGLHLMARRRPVLLGALAAVYALAYTASHVLLILALIAAILQVRFTRRPALELPLAVAAGLIVGFALHPNFPHNLAIWKVQNIDFYRFAWVRDLLGLGVEIKPLSGLEFLRQHAVLLLAWGVVGAASIRRWRSITYEGAVFGTGAAAFGVMAWSGARFTEYWVPLSVVALAVLARDLELSTSRLSPIRRRLLVSVSVLAITAGAAHNLSDIVAYLRALAPAKEAYDRSIREMSAILSREAPGEIVYHSAWSDSPALLMFNDRSRYLVVLDPIYFLEGDRTRYLAYRAINEGGALPPELEPLAAPDTPLRLDVVSTLQTQFSTRFVVVRADHRGLIDALTRAAGVQVRYRSPTHMLFELTATPARSP